MAMCSTCSSPIRCISLATKSSSLCFFFFNDTATTEIYTLSLHDALPIFTRWGPPQRASAAEVLASPTGEDRKSTRLNSSHSSTSYAGFCLKKKNQHKQGSVWVLVILLWGIRRLVLIK